MWPDGWTILVMVIFVGVIGFGVWAETTKPYEVRKSQVVGYAPRSLQSGELVMIGGHWYYMAEHASAGTLLEFDEDKEGLVRYRGWH